MTRPASAVLATLVAVLGASAPSEAQTSRPGVDCSLLTAQQAQGLPCANAPQADEPPTSTPTTRAGVDCRRINPYAEPDLALECSRQPSPDDRTPTFVIGSVYAYGYRSLEAVILGLTTDTDGVQIITYRWLPRSGSFGVHAQRTPPSPGGSTNWYLVRARVESQP